MKTKSLLSVLVLSVCALVSSGAHAKLNVVTTIPDLRFIADQVGKEYISVESIAKGTQDPHAIEAKPSFMVKVSRADLVVAIGLDLEMGWLPSIILGSRNPKIKSGSSGYLEVGALVQPLEVMHGEVTRADGDVHPAGNPHVTLDPLRAGQVAIFLAQRLGELDPTHASLFKQNAEKFKADLEVKTKIWKARIEKSGVKAVVTYHKTFTYFLDRFKIENPAILEPKPGIPPTSGHILKVIEIIRDQKVPVVLIENYFDPTVTQKISQSVKVRSAVVPVSVDGASGMNSLFDVYENLVRQIEGK